VTGPRRYVRCAPAPSAACLFLCAALAGPARGDEDPKRYSIHPSLTVTGVFNDNVLFEESGKKSDVGAWIAPRLDLGYRGRSWQVGTDLGADIRRYTDSPSLDEEFFRVKAFAEVGLLTGLTFRVSDIYTPQPVQLGFPEDESANLEQTNRLLAELKYWRKFKSGRELETGIRGTWFVADSFPADVPGPGGGIVRDPNFNPNYYEGAFYSELQQPLGRRNMAFFRNQFRYRAFKGSSDTDFFDLSLLAGFRSEWIQDVEFEAAAGYGLLSYPNGRDKHRALGKASLSQKLSHGFRWKLSGASRFTADLTGQNFIETTGRASLEKRFGERTKASIGGFVSRFKSDLWNDANRYAGAEAAIEHQLTRRIKAALRYRYWNNGGGNDIDDFDQNWLALEFSYRR
jgi:hypothetical protein